MSLRVFHAAGRGPAQSWSPGLRLPLSEEESHYLLRVRRAAIGTELEVLDGVAIAWRATLVEARGRTAVVELLSPRVGPETAPLCVLLLVPEPRATLECLTLAAELGASLVVLVKGERSPAGLPTPSRIERTLLAAQRQCARPTPPKVELAASLTAALASTEAMPGFVARPGPHAHEPLPALEPATGARVLVGPEGGLSPSEDALATEAGLRPLGLGPWVLRTPTAVTAALARLQAAMRPRDARC